MKNKTCLLISVISAAFLLLFSSCKKQQKITYTAFPEYSSKDIYKFPTRFSDYYNFKTGFHLKFDYNDKTRMQAEYGLISGSGTYFATGSCRYTTSYKNPQTKTKTEALVLEPPAKEKIDFSKCNGTDKEKQELLDYFFPDDKPCIIIYNPDYCEMDKQGGFVYKDSVFFDPLYTKHLSKYSETMVCGIPSVYTGYRKEAYTIKTKTFAYSKPDINSQIMANPNINWNDYVIDKKVTTLTDGSNYPFYHGDKLNFNAHTKEKFTLNGVEDYWYYFENSHQAYWIFGAELEDYDKSKTGEYDTYIIENGIKDGFIEISEIDYSKYPSEIKKLSIGEEDSSVVYYNDEKLYFAYPYSHIFAEYDRNAMKADTDGFVKFSYGPKEKQKAIFILGDAFSQYFTSFNKNGKIQYQEEEPESFGTGRYHDYYFEDITASSFFTETIGGKKIEYKPENLTRCFEVGCRCHPYWWNYSHIPWVEGAEGNGIGEALTITFKEAMAGMSVLNGYTELNKLKLYKENARLKEVLIEDLINNTSWTIQFKDEVYFNYISFPQKTTKVKMTIKSVYEGTKYQDTCVSAIIPQKDDNTQNYKEYIYEDFKEMIRTSQEVTPEQLLSTPY